MEQQNQTKHYYETLGLSPGASVEEIRAQFKKLVRVYHPDRFARDDEKVHVAQKLRDINEAYTVLTEHQSAMGNGDQPQPLRSMLQPRPLLEPDLLDFGHMSMNEREQLVFRVDNQGAEARRFGLSVNARDDWFRVATGKQVDERNAFPVEFTVLPNTQSLAPGQRYDGWIDVTMDTITKRLPVSMEVAEQPTTWFSLTFLRWATAGLALLTLVLFLWPYVGAGQSPSAIAQNVMADVNSALGIADANRGATAPEETNPSAVADANGSSDGNSDGNAGAADGGVADESDGEPVQVAQEITPTATVAQDDEGEAFPNTASMEASATSTESETIPEDTSVDGIVEPPTQGLTLTAVMRAGVALPQEEEIIVEPTVQDESIIARIRERGELVVGVNADSRPFGYRLDDGQLAGFEIDLMREFARIWLGDPDAVQFVPVTPATRIERLAAGDIDMIAAAMTHTKSREQFIDYSQTYFLDGENILVSAESGIETVEDLRGRTIAVVEGSTGAVEVVEFLLANDLIRQDSDIIEADFEIVTFEQYTQAINPLLQGDIDAVATNRGILLGIAQEVAEDSEENPGLALLFEENFAERPYGFGLPSGDSYLKNLVDFTLQQLKREGIYDELYTTWFGAEQTPYAVELLPGEWPYTLETSPVTVDTDVPSVVEKIIEEGEFVAGLSFTTPLFGFRDESGRAIGFEADILREFARRWLGNTEAVQFVRVDGTERIEKLANREVDIVASSLTHTQDRDELIDFSLTYFFDGQNLLVREDSGITSVADLDGMTIGAAEGSTSIERIASFAEENGISIEIAEFSQNLEFVRPLLEGDIDAVTSDRGILLGIARDNPSLTILLEDNISAEPYGLGVPNFDDRFRDLVNFTLQDMVEDGTYDSLYRYWFGTEVTGSSDVDVFDLEVWPGTNYLATDLAPMVYVEPGQSLLGRESGDEIVPVEYDARPQRVVELDGYYIDQYEVTNRLYERCVAAGVCNEPIATGLLRDPEYYFSDEFASHPVVYVTWYDAQNYCSYAGKELPTEVQWEKAARGLYSEGDEQIYLFPWGDTYDRAEPRASYDENFTGLPQLVGSFRYGASGVSPFGVHDMAGNVREWTADCYVQRYYDELEDGVSNPAANLSCEAGDNRVVRGGGWNELIFDLTTTRRQSVEPTNADRNLGFRCVSQEGPVSAFRTDILDDSSE